MAVPSSGEVTFSDLQDEFGGSHPITMSEYAARVDKEEGDEIKLSEFRGKEKFDTQTYDTEGIETYSGYPTGVPLRFKLYGPGAGGGNGPGIDGSCCGDPGGDGAYVEFVVTFSQETSDHEAVVTLSAPGEGAQGSGSCSDGDDAEHPGCQVELRSGMNDPDVVGSVSTFTAYGGDGGDVDGETSLNPDSGMHSISSESGTDGGHSGSGGSENCGEYEAGSDGAPGYVVVEEA